MRYRYTPGSIRAVFEKTLGIYRVVALLLAKAPLEAVSVNNTSQFANILALTRRPCRCYLISCHATGSLQGSFSGQENSEKEKAHFQFELLLNSQTLDFLHAG